MVERALGILNRERRQRGNLGRQLMRQWQRLCNIPGSPQRSQVMADMRWASSAEASWSGVEDSLAAVVTSTESLGCGSRVVPLPVLAASVDPRRLLGRGLVESVQRERRELSLSPVATLNSTFDGEGLLHMYFAAFSAFFVG